MSNASFTDRIWQEGEKDIIALPSALGIFQRDGVRLNEYVCGCVCVFKILALSSSSSQNPHFSSSSWCSSKISYFSFLQQTGILPTPQLVYRDYLGAQQTKSPVEDFLLRICSSVQFSRSWSSFVAAKILVFLCFLSNSLCKFLYFFNSGTNIFSILTSLKLECCHNSRHVTIQNNNIFLS